MEDMTRLCKKCLIEKPITEFNKNKNGKDGYRGKCKRCSADECKIRNKEYRKDPSWVAKERQRCREKASRYKKDWRENPKYSSDWRRRNPEKWIAQCKANNAVQTGKLKRKDSCEICGQPSMTLDKHHHDYSKPLEVLWVCKPCHGKLTRKPLPKLTL